MRRELDQVWTSIDPDWAVRWDEQVNDFFEIRTAVLPWRSCSDKEIGQLLAGECGFEAAFPDVFAVRSLADAIPEHQQPGYVQNSAGQFVAAAFDAYRLAERPPERDGQQGWGCYLKGVWIDE